MIGSVNVPVDNVILPGDLALPDRAKGLVIFSHGSGSSRHSSRNRFVAQRLQLAGFGTFLFDLLTEHEDVDVRKRFDIDLLSRRLTLVTQWLLAEDALRAYPFGYFGASTGAASAIIAASTLKTRISAIVSRGGRPDLAGDRLRDVTAPTLFIVGGEDHEVLELNRKAIRKMTAPNKLTVVWGATHLFEERGALEEVTANAEAWFGSYLNTSRTRSKASIADKQNKSDIS